MTKGAWIVVIVAVIVIAWYEYSDASSDGYGSSSSSTSTSSVLATASSAVQNLFAQSGVDLEDIADGIENIPGGAQLWFGNPGYVGNNSD